MCIVKSRVCWYLLFIVTPTLSCMCSTTQEEAEVVISDSFSGQAVFFSFHEYDNVEGVIDNSQIPS